MTLGKRKGHKTKEDYKMSRAVNEMLCNGRATRMGCALLLVFMIAGCKTMSGGANLTADEQMLQEDAQVFEETVVGGAMTGALLGGLGCALLGGDTKDCIVAAGVGGAVGGLAGYMTATEQRAAKQQVRQIDVITEDIEEENNKIKKFAALAEKVLAQNRAEARKLRARIASKKAKASEMETLQARMESSRDSMNVAITRLQKKRDEFVQVADNLKGKGEDTTKIRQAVKDMEGQIALIIEYRTALEEELKVEVMG